MEKKKNRKEWIKNAIIIFLVVMLVLTFCSNTIMNLYLPEVSTEAATSGKIQESVRGSGTAELTQAFQVKIAGNRTIKTVNVKNGQDVKKGDILFTLEESDGNDLETAKSTFLELQTEYQKKLLGTNYNYDKDTLAIENARADYDKAVEKLNSIDSKTVELTKKQKTLSSYDAKITKYETNISTYDTQITDLSTKSDVDACQIDLTTKQRTLVGLKNNLTDIEADLATLTSTAGTDPKDITDKQREKRDKEVEISNAQGDVNSAQAALDTAKTNKQLIDSLKTKKDKTSLKLTNLKAKQTTLSAEIETLKTSIPSKEEAQASVDEKEATWDSLVTDFEAKKSEDEHTKKSDEIDLNAAKQKLIVQKKVVEEIIASSSKTEITADVEGTITSINCAAGDITQPDTALATIASKGEGFSVKISVSKEKAVKVKTGQQATVENFMYGDDIKAVLTEISNDTETPGNSILTFSVSAETINEGDNITLAIGGESKSYDVIVPKSSIYEDNDGKFVLTLDSKSTPLGERYIATRHNVEVVAEDDTHSAITGDLLGYEYVIMTSSEALKSGEQVKLKE